MTPPRSLALREDDCYKAPMADMQRCLVEFKGIVQGVGFRPAIFKLARKLGITGWIQNRSGNVVASLDGPERSIQEFLSLLDSALPTGAKVESAFVISREPLRNDELSAGFSIRDGDDAGEFALTVPPDLAICADCQREIGDRLDRRFRYAFTTCTACGPRYTVINSMPYDRSRTTMARFPLCPQCSSEFEDPANRRFHAETTACPQCGPRLTLRIRDGAAIDGDPLVETRKLLAAGKIVAVRGTGGFLLAADARNRRTISLLRERKHRPHKPFALMAGDISAASRHCVLGSEAAELLSSKAAPIVILDVKPGESGLPVDLLSPDTGTLGVMLPSSPLHRLIFEQGSHDEVAPFDMLIMTSGNRRSEPICLANEEAMERLGDIADAFLLHDREIALRNDDSLCVIMCGRPQIWRRARGYAPAPVPLDWKLDRTVLAMGAEIKNTVALGFDSQVAISPHAGDLETPEAVAGMLENAGHLPAFLRKSPHAVAVDLHPDMHSTIAGREIARRLGIPVVDVQHHHAHGAACLAENGSEEGLALVFDGTGLGADGLLWGAELLHVFPGGFRRLATFDPVPLPGGDAAVLRPARQAVARLDAAGVMPDQDWMDSAGVSPEEADVWIEQARKGLNAPPTHSAGRLLDAMSVLLGSAPRNITYEGQPAIRLEALAAKCAVAKIGMLPISVAEMDGMLRVNWNDAVREVFSMSRSRGREPEVAMMVHGTVALAASMMISYGLDRARTSNVALSGGVFMNRILNNMMKERAEQAGFRLLLHGQTPPNDGCISFGQAVIAGRVAPCALRCP